MIYSNADRKAILPSLIMHFGVPAVILLIVLIFAYRTPGAGFLETASIFAGLFFAIFFGSKEARLSNALLIHYYFGVVKQKTITTSPEGIRGSYKDKKENISIKWDELNRMKFDVPYGAIEKKSLGSYVAYGRSGQRIAISPIVEKRDDLIREIIQNAHLKKIMATKFIDKYPTIAEWHKTTEALTDFDLNIQPRAPFFNIHLIWQIPSIAAAFAATMFIAIVITKLFIGMPWPWEI